MANGRLDSTLFKDGLTLLDKFTTKSKLYNFSNYIYLESKNNILNMTAPIVLGQAISSGIARVTVPYMGDDFETVAVGKDELSGVSNKLKGEAVNLLIGNGPHPTVKIEVEGEVKLTLPTADSVIPPMFMNNLSTLRGEERKPLPLEDVQNVVKELNKDLKSQLISHSYQGIYVTDLWSFVTNGMYMTGNILPKDLDSKFYIPKHAVQIISSIPKGEYTYSQKVLGVDPTASPYLHIQGDNIELYFQEWMSKDVYPIDQMVELAGLSGEQVPITDLEKIIKWIIPKSNIVRFNFREGKAFSSDGSVQVDIEVKDLDEAFYAKSVLPNATGVKSYSEVEILDNGFMKFNGATMCRICSPLESPDE